ncbi:hypothetical protein K2173_008352 [Erythroxylum novogranatense]|uniref:Gamma-tubulin complex component n=1 Tax=Erythroxylum novogranatense TaxID=1862640 RepID=A0AAV8TJ58_9ROSI|nr:hypothetical protein K2173_008352 [Erythroxylum novogranatense]
MNASVTVSQSRSSNNSSKETEAMREPAPTSNTFHRRYDTCKEASLVKLALNALQGVQSAILSIEKLHASFSSDSADRTHLQNSSLWNRSSSTQALGKILKSIGCSGTLVCLLRKFVDSFLNLNCHTYSVSKSYGVSESTRDQCHCDGNAQKEEHPPYSLVNQAFAVAVGKVLDGYVCALDTLSASVYLRRSLKSAELPPYANYGSECLTNVVHSEVNLLELYLHTKDLRTRIEALGNICELNDIALCFSVSPFEDLISTATLKFFKFQRGGDLLTYLYEHLQVADPGYCALLKYLFLCSYEPYCDFIRSWIFKAELSDPYEEFVIKFVESESSCVDFKAGIPIHFSLASLRDGVAIPCFLKDFLSPLVRAGQQLQVLKKLFELCNHVAPADYTFEDFLPCWDGYAGSHFFCPSTLTFNKQGLEAMVLARDIYYKKMLQKLEILLLKLEFRHRQVVSQSGLPFFIDQDGGSLRTSSTSHVDDRWNCPSIVEKQSSKVADDKIDSDCPSPEGELYGFGSSDLSECSSLSGSEVPNETEQLNDHRHCLVENLERELSSLGFCNHNPVDKTLEKPKNGGRAPDTDDTLHEDDEKTYDRFVHSSREEATVGYMFVPHDLESKWSCISNTLCKDDSPNSCSPLHFLKNGQYDDERYKYQMSLNGVNCVQEAVETNVGVLDEGISHFCGMSIAKGALIAETLSRYERGKDNFTSELLTLRPWKLNHSKFLSANPMSKENRCFYLRRVHGRRCTSVYKQSSTCFDFSFVEDPCKVTLEKLTSRLTSPMGYQTLSGMTAFANGCESHDKGKHGFGRDNIVKDNVGVSFLYPSSDSKEHAQGTAVLKNVYGGSHWECLLGSFSYNDEGNGQDQNNISSTFEIPLDVIIEKCLLQEILLQYKYVSKLAIKLLEEGFHLQQHLLALRRYYFMELADWADIFIMSLSNHKWCIAEAHQRVSDIQGFLEMSVQRSSCERDPYKDRLFVYIKGNSIMPLSTSAIGVRSFNFLGLGYRVDWPVSIVLTHDALRIYSEIFSFLIQVKLAVFSLTDVWSLLKDLTRLQCCPGEHESKVGRFKMFTKIWHQVNHFVSTLCQYVQSQLSQLSWCGFLQSLNYKVKDMMDLESVHMAYLVDSLNICFLSDEMRAIASIIENILQCALDFRSCLNSNWWDVKLDPSDSPGEIPRINTSQVQTIKQKFDRNLKELYVYYLKSPKHGELGLSRLWGLLNYNDYYRDIVNRMDLYGFQV